ncbi:hypothetical protein JTB14_009885 [Gonioctena quinquepunctata]|nr:hypothetical protein JTB14_009885 [Gonioctena quinquepunctata]
MWRSRFENYMKASEVNKKSESTQCAQLIHYIGKESFRIHRTFQIPKEDQDKLKVLLKKFEKHFLPKENLFYERYILFMMRQQSGQSLEKFIVDLRVQAKKCKFDMLHEMHDNLWGEK